MEGLAYMGGALLAIGGATAWRVRKSRGPSLRVILAVLAGGSVLALVALVLPRAGEQVAEKPTAPAKPVPTAEAPAVPVPADPWANPDSPAIKEQVRAAYEEYQVLLAQAARELKPELLDQAATGDHLAFLKEQLRRTQEAGFALVSEDEAEIWAMTPAPMLRNVSVQVKGTFRTWDVDPKTGQKVGEPLVKQGERNYVFVWSEGRWKVKQVVFFEGS